MKIVHYHDPVDFQKAITDSLLRHEAENNLQLGLLANLIAGEYLDKNPYMAIIQDEGNPYSILLCTPPFPVIFSYLEDTPPRDLLKEILFDIKETLGEDFIGVTGMKSLALELVNIWLEETGIHYRLNTAMRVYKLNQVIPVEDVPGELRKAKPEDQSLMQEWFFNFNRDIWGVEPDPASINKQIQRYLTADPEMRGLMFWDVEGKPVSMAGYAGPTPNGIRIGAVYTPPAMRRKGFASACTAALSQNLLNTGYKFCFLFTDLMNPTSNKIYQQIGYDAVCDVDRYDFINETKEKTDR
jgi:GNAT superfamily N-acetyltransferase